MKYMKKEQRFAIRKCTVGVGSILLGVFFTLNMYEAKANEVSGDSLSYLELGNNQV